MSLCLFIFIKEANCILAFNYFPAASPSLLGTADLQGNVHVCTSCQAASLGRNTNRNLIFNQLVIVRERRRESSVFGLDSCYQHKIAFAEQNLMDFYLKSGIESVLLRGNKSVCAITFL